MGKIFTSRIGGKLYILKLQERSDKDEELTLQSEGVKQQVTDELVKARKSLLSASYQAIAMNEAKIENFLAQKLVANPNELSGARPASTPGDANANTNANSSGPSANANSKPAANANTAGESKSAANAPAKPAATAPAKPAANNGSGAANAIKGK
jgi:hypothetical protein